MHFESKGGGLQRTVIEWYVGELTLTYYPLGTNRVVRWGVRGAESEMLDLQKKLRIKVAL